MKQIDTYLDSKTFDNRTIVEEENEGYAKDFVQHHQTTPDASEIIKHLTWTRIIEVIH